MARTERQERMELLARQNTARGSYPRYREQISELLGREVDTADVLDLPSTDELYSKWLSTWSEQEREKHVLRKRWPFEDKQGWISASRCTADKLGVRTVALMIGPFKYCGAVRTTAANALMDPLALLEQDQGEIRVKSLEDDSGICVDWFEERSEYLIELVVWGKWCELVRPCFD